MQALCGTGLEWTGRGAWVVNASFLGNGAHFDRHTQQEDHSWSDGLTLDSGPGAVVDTSWFVDNSDVNLIIGGGTGARITNNRVWMTGNAAFAGIMLDNFNSNPNSDFTGALVTNNTVRCQQRCHFGIELGPHPWYNSANIFGGLVTGNTVSGAGVLLNVDGAGTAAQPFTVFNNTLAGPCAPGIEFLCRKTLCQVYNIAPDSVVDRRGDPTPASAIPWAGCP
mgnify:CR=1 FL=1